MSLKTNTAKDLLLPTFKEGKHSLPTIQNNSCRVSFKHNPCIGEGWREYKIWANYNDLRRPPLTDFKLVDFWSILQNLIYLGTCRTVGGLEIRWVHVLTSIHFLPAVDTPKFGAIPISENAATATFHTCLRKEGIWGWATSLKQFLKFNWTKLLGYTGWTCIYVYIYPNRFEVITNW